MVITDRRAETVFVTKDFAKFKLADWNRDINTEKVKKLIRFISESGYQGAPIIVNEKFEICDGQHRYMACRTLNVAIPYIIRPNFAHKECTRLNELKTGWTMFDHVSSLAKSGDPDAKVFCKIIEDFNDIPKSAVIEIMSIGRWAKKCNYEGISSGEFHIISESGIRECLSCINEFVDIMTKYKLKGRSSIYVCRALARLYIIRDHQSANNIDMGRMKKQFETYVVDISKSMTSTDNVLDALLEVYNKKLRDNKKTFTSSKEVDRVYREYRKCSTNTQKKKM